MATFSITRRTCQQISHEVVTAAMKVHTELGAGLLESAYLACLKFELEAAGLHAATQVPLPVVYRGVKLDIGYRMILWLRIPSSSR
jgi:GxxExxY protein